MEEKTVIGEMGPELIVHVGLPKTGTTAIQRYMYLNREALATQGVYWAETYPGAISESDDWAHHIYSHKWGGWLNPAEFPVTPDEAWRALGESIRTKGGRHVISSERFADLLPTPAGDDVLSFIVDAVFPVQVKIICYIRRQDDLAESHLRVRTH